MLFRLTLTCPMQPSAEYGVAFFPLLKHCFMASAQRGNTCLGIQFMQSFIFFTELQTCKWRRRKIILDFGYVVSPSKARQCAFFFGVCASSPHDTSLPWLAVPGGPLFPCPRTSSLHWAASRTARGPRTFRSGVFSESDHC